LGEIAFVATFLTLSLEGASLELHHNKYEKKNIQKQPENIKHKKNKTNENVTHAKNRRHKT
jgi:hypothetical protein